MSINAFGSDGPDAQLAAHDVNAQSLAGLLSLNCDDAGAPVMPGVQMCDLAAGMQAALAVLAGLTSVSNGGAGYRAEVAMSDVALGLTGLAGGHLAADQGSLPPARDSLTGGLACYSQYRCADGRWLVSGGLEPKFFAATCEAIGAPELAALQYDLARQGELRGRLADIFATRTLAQWSTVLRPADTCVTPVNDIGEAFAEPNAVSRGVITAALLSDGRRVPVVRAVPWLVEGDAPTSPPVLGADGERLLMAAGLPAESVAALRAAGIVGGPS